MQTLLEAISMDHVTLGFSVESLELSWQLLKPGHMQLSLPQSHTATT